MFILTKRTAPSDKGNMMHSIHGYTNHVAIARAWFRATRTTDVIDVPFKSQSVEHCFGIHGDSMDCVIRENRFESWREQQLRDELAMAKMRGCAK